MREGWKQTQKKKCINKILLCVCQEYKTFVMHRLSCSGSSIHLYGNQDGSEDILEAEFNFTAQLLTISSMQDISNAIANRLCLLRPSLLPQRTVDFMLSISVPAQIQLSSTERLLANEHRSLKETPAFTWCLLQRSSVPLSLHIYHLSAKRKKKGGKEGYSIFMLC